MSLAMCPLCGDDEEIGLVRTMDDGRRLVECKRCDHQWEHGVATVRPAYSRLGYSFDQLRARFPKPEDVDPDVLVRVNRLKAEYLQDRPDFDPKVAAYWSKYQEVFSRDGLWSCDPQLLKDFANSEVGARPGIQSVFNTAWNEMGQQAAAESTRQTIEHLLYGPTEYPLEDRLNQLLDGEKPFAMKGFKEALLTRVLCVVEPQRFLSILTYTSERGGKREIAKAVYGLDFPQPERVAWTRGRLILWSNDVLNALVGNGFANQQHSAAFLWWAKDQPGAVRS